MYFVVYVVRLSSDFFDTASVSGTSFVRSLPALGECQQTIVKSKVYIFTRFVFIHFVYTFYINILGNKIDLEIPSGIAQGKFVKSYHATLMPS